jgi:hypothetical protein
MNAGQAQRSLRRGMARLQAPLTVELPLLPVQEHEDLALLQNDKLVVEGLHQGERIQPISAL